MYNFNKQATYLLKCGTKLPIFVWILCHPLRLPTAVLPCPLQSINNHRIQQSSTSQPTSTLAFVSSSADLYLATTFKKASSDNGGPRETISLPKTYYGLCPQHMPRARRRREDRQGRWNSWIEPIRDRPLGHEEYLSWEFNDH